MTTPAVRTLEERHQESQGPWPESGHVCLTCWQPWPCDARALLDAVEAAIPLIHDPSPDAIRAFQAALVPLVSAPPERRLPNE